MTGAPHIFDRRLLRMRRDRVARHAARYEFLLARVADDLAERLAAVRRTFPVVLDLGAQHGLLGRRIGRLPGVTTVISAEASARLLAQCDGPRVACDEEVLPFRDRSLDLVVSGLSLQHANDLPGVLAQVRRALKPDGLLLAAMLGGATLHELRTSLIAAEEELEGGASPRVSPFADVRDMGALLQRAQFALPVVDSETVVATYANPLALMHEIRGMGAANSLSARSRKPLRRATLLRSFQIYVERFGLANGRIPATFEILTLTGWAPHESQQKPLQPGSARMRLADALGTIEQRGGEQPAGDSIRPPKTSR
jgi:NADH dehydrogenase [ubiquinone] 1 alpha subcomplex assembly factor 5